MKIEREIKIPFEDVLIKPAYSTIINRETEIDISVDFLGKKIIPIISSNMDYVTGVRMALAMENTGALGILNRFEPLVEQLMESMVRPTPLYISVGIRDFEDSLARIRAFNPYGICIDVAHGDHQQVVRLIDAIKLKYDKKYKIIAGNIATQDGFYNLATAGIDAIKVGIGPGSVCTTRSVTGCGVPQLSAIIECAEERDKYFPDVQIIADGGINSSGDIVKALAAGADAVMLGRLLAGHDECPGPKESLIFRSYRGQSINGTNRIAPEGIEGTVPYRGPVENTIKKLAAGIRSGFSYVGARNIQELRDNTVFQLVSNATKHESNTRVLQEI